MVSFPEVLHVGFSKCASTFLQTFFEDHQAIFLVNQSHFFAPFEFSNYDSGQEEYYGLFDKAADRQVKLESDEHIVLPLFHPTLAAAATTIDSIAEVSRRIKSVNENARIILVIRNQGDLIVSRYSEYILGGGKDDFNFFVEEFLKCSKDGINYYQNYYAEIMEIFRHDFGGENVLVLLQEELSRDEGRTIDRLCTFIGVQLQQPKRRGSISRRVGLSNLGIKVVRRMNRALVIRQEMSYQKARTRIPYLLYKIVQRLLRVLDYYLPKWLKGDKNEILTATLKTRLRNEFREDTARLSVLLEKDLSSLGY